MAALFGKFKITPALINKCSSPRYVKFSSQPANEASQEPPRFRTFENDPTQHTEKHVGKFYTIAPNIKEKLFFNGGIPKSLDIQMKTFNECSIMVRPPAIEIMSLLKQIDYRCPAVRFVIYGKIGTGKTSTLIHIVHYAHAANYLILHVPWVSNWTKRPKEVVDSQSRPGRIDLPVESGLWLQHFKLQNLHLLEELKLECSNTYTWSKREVTEQGKPLMEIVDHGINRVRHASDCIAVLLKEIKKHSLAGRFKTMVVIDGVNTFYCKTNVKRPDRSLVPATEITIVHAFEKILRNDWTHAAVVTSVDTLPVCRDETISVPHTPRALLGKEGFEILDPFIPVQVENYTNKEIESVLDYYTDRMWIQLEEARSENGRKELKFLSGNHPRDLMMLCESL